MINLELMANTTQQKLRGGYYTPREMTEFIIDWAFSDGNKKRVLEPSCGDGAFLEILLEYSDKFEECIAIELDKEEAEKASRMVGKEQQIQIINNDFFKEYKMNLSNEKFDLIIGNPPYIRYQFLTTEQRELHAEILVNNKMKPNKLINAWVSFLVSCVERLNNDGKIAMVIPAELLQVSYAADLRLFLSNNLSNVTIITFKKLVFPDVQQEVVILLGEKIFGEKETKISVVELYDLSELNHSFFSRELEYKEIDHTKDKWTKYFLNEQELAAIKKIEKHAEFKKLSEYALVQVGITTGNNKYFSVTSEIIQEYGLEDVAVPLIGRSAHAKGLYFNKQDWLENVQNNQPANLLIFPDVPFDELSKSHQDYIKHGEDTNQHTGYKCKIRNNWYRVPSTWSPDAFFLRRNDLYPKFVLNNIEAVSTDTMHRIKFKENVDKMKVVLGYYNSISLAFTEIEGRSYGGGVLEVLPGEVGDILIPDLSNLDDTTAKRLLELIDSNIRTKGDIRDILPQIDKEILVEYCGLDEQFVLTFRSAWTKLMTRRRER